MCNVIFAWYLLNNYNFSSSTEWFPSFFLEKNWRKTASLPKETGRKTAAFPKKNRRKSGIFLKKNRRKSGVFLKKNGRKTAAFSKKNGRKTAALPTKHGTAEAAQMEAEWGAQPKSVQFLENLYVSWVIVWKFVYFFHVFYYNF